MVKRLISLCAMLALVACATSGPAIPESYDGPIAKVTDSMTNVTVRQGDFCVLSALDGRPISNSINETIERGRGKGMTLYVWITDRRVPARPTKAGIKCQTVHAAPILALTGNVYSVEGVVDFNPRDDGRYVVKGILAATASSVWIEDTLSGEIVTTKVIGAK